MPIWVVASVEAELSRKVKVAGINKLVCGFLWMAEFGPKCLKAHGKYSPI
jgi:hypothetical protein